MIDASTPEEEEVSLSPLPFDQYRECSGFIRKLRDSSDDAPSKIQPQPFNGACSDDFFKNIAMLVERDPEIKPVKGYKIVTNYGPLMKAMTNMGKNNPSIAISVLQLDVSNTVIAVFHMIGKKDGIYCDPTPGEDYIFVPSSVAYPELSADQMLSMNANVQLLSGAIYSSPIQKQWGIMTESPCHGFCPAEAKLLALTDVDTLKNKYGLSLGVVAAAYGIINEGNGMCIIPALALLSLIRKKERYYLSFVKKKRSSSR